jgi:TrmH family RNA methyltransferase
MLKREELDRLVVVLVRARNPANIGAVARAMHDFGFGALRVVNEFTPPFEAAKSAVDAGAVMDAAKMFDTVAAAVEDCALVVGTTAVGERDIVHPLYALEEAAGRVCARLSEGEGRVAVLFGSEKTGLSNEELSHCDWLLTIPMEQHLDVRHPSMNLGQAVAVCLYELKRQIGLLETVASHDPELAGAAERERLTQLLGEVLEAAEYRRHHPANSDEAQLRRLVTRMGLPAVDAPVWMGMLRQVLWRLKSRAE